MSHPDFLVVGAGKSATTWLHECLDTHPRVFVPPMKEMHFFCPDSCPKSRFAKGREWYEAQFPEEPGIVKGEISVDYAFYYTVTAEEIASRYPGAKILFLLRHPVERAWSDYWMHRRNNPELPPLEEHDDEHSFIARGFYYRQIAKYLEFFPRERVKILYYDDLTADPAGFIRSVYEFLEVDAAFMPPALKEKIGATHVIASPLGRFIYRRMGNLAKIPAFLALWRWLKRHTPIKRILFGEAKKAKGGYERMSPELRRHLLLRYEEQNRKLFELTGRRISAWER